MPTKWHLRVKNTTHQWHRRRWSVVGMSMCFTLIVSSTLVNWCLINVIEWLYESSMQVIDSAAFTWLVHIVSPHGRGTLVATHWQQLVQHLSPFAVRFGMYDCRHDARYCFGVLCLDFSAVYYMSLLCYSRSKDTKDFTGHLSVQRLPALAVVCFLPACATRVSSARNAVVRICFRASLVYLCLCPPVE